MVYKHISELIGNTPILKISKEITGLKNINLYAKLEYMNPFGSVKDRIAKNMLEPVKEGAIKSKKTILEASSGNTGKALAILSSTYDINFKAVTNRLKIPEVRMLFQISGASVEELPGVSDCPDLNDPNTYTSVAQKMAKDNPDLYEYTDQYFNNRNWEAHLNTGKEIAKDLEQVDYLITFLGTAGTSKGIYTELKKINPEIKLIGIVAAPNEVIPGGRNMNELWETGFFNKSDFHEIIPVSLDHALDGVIELLRNSGILAGPTSGAQYIKGLEYLYSIDENVDGSNAIFIACDGIENYLNFIKSKRPELFSASTTKRKKVTDVSIDKIETKDIDLSSNEVTESVENLVIDIRNNFSYSIGHIPSSINILDQNLIELIEEGNIFPKTKKIIIVCRNGDLSKKIAYFLKVQGYNAFSLKGGILQWKNNGLELVRD